MPKSFDFEDMWSFNHPHLSVKDFWKQLRRVEVFIEKRKFPTFQEEEHNDYNFTLKSSLLQVWEYTKAKREERFVPKFSKKQE